MKSIFFFRPAFQWNNMERDSSVWTAINAVCDQELYCFNRTRPFMKTTQGSMAACCPRGIKYNPGSLDLVTDLWTWRYFRAQNNSSSTMRKYHATVESYCGGNYFLTYSTWNDPLELRDWLPERLSRRHYVAMWSSVTMNFCRHPSFITRRIFFK